MKMGNDANAECVCVCQCGYGESNVIIIYEFLIPLVNLKLKDGIRKSPKND